MSADVPELLDPSDELIIQWIESSIGSRVSGFSRTYQRRKPGQSVVVGFRARHSCNAGVDSDLPLDGYVWAPADRVTDSVLEKQLNLHPVSVCGAPGVSSVANGSALLFLFPNDRLLRGLRNVCDVDKLKRTLASLPVVAEEGWRVRAWGFKLDFIRYKPERRLIVKIRARLKKDADGSKRKLAAHARFFPDERGANIHSSLQRLCKGGLSDIVPTPLGVLSDGRLQVEETLEGVDYLDSLCGEPISGAEEQIVRSLCRLHELPLLPTDTAFGPQDVHARACLSLTRMAGEHPEAVATIREAIDRLMGEVSSARVDVPCHGDFHGHQILLNEDSAQLIDFERLVAGDPLLDFSALQADLLARAGSIPEASDLYRDAAARLLDAWHSLTPVRIMNDLRFYLICGLVEQAHFVWRRPDKHMGRTGAAILAECLPFVLDRRVVRPHPVKLSWNAETTAGSVGALDPRTGELRLMTAMDDSALRCGVDYLKTGDIVSHRPGRRAVLRLEEGGDVTWVKVMRPKKARLLAQRWGALRATGPITRSLRIPRLLNLDEEAGALVFSDVKGTQLHDLLKRGEFSATLLAQSICSWQSLLNNDDVHHEVGVEDLVDWAEVADSADQKLGDAVRLLLPRAAPRIDHAVAVLVHGDLHDKNIILDGRSVGFIDMDGMGRGSPSQDVGNLGAHLVLRALQLQDDPGSGERQAHQLRLAFLKTGAGCSEDSILHEEARALIRLAVLYRFRPDGCRVSTTLIEAAKERLS